MDRHHPCENCSDLYDMYVEIETIFQNITHIDQRIFVYLLEDTIYNFYHGQYDESYKLPWTDLCTSPL